MRVKFVSRKIKETRPPADVVPVSDAPTPVSDPSRLSIFDRLVRVIGFRKLTDEEYLEALKKQRDEALARIAVIERERRERVDEAIDATEKPT